MIQSPRCITVLTGDLVKSTSLGTSKISRAFGALEGCAERLAALQDAPLHFSRHRGDGWQIALERPALALRATLAFRAALRAQGQEFDSYIGMAEGNVTGSIGPDLNDETTEVFIRSGEMLELVKRASAGRIRMEHSLQGPVRAVILLADCIVQGWTPIQASTMLHMLLAPEAPSFTDTASELGKSRQAVAKSLDAAGYDFIRAALESLEDTPEND